MALSEDEVKDMAERVEEGILIDLPFEIDWTRIQLAAAEKAEKENVLAFRLHKRLGLHDHMKTNETALTELRKSIKYMRQRLEELRKAE